MIALKDVEEDEDRVVRGMKERGEREKGRGMITLKNVEEILLQFHS